MARKASPKPEAPGRLPPGTLVAEFFVPMRPSPWRAPTVTRKGHAFKDPKLLAWQAEVGQCARVAMAGLGAPYAHPVELVLNFFLTRKPGSPPDLSNLVKATEDSVQQIVIANDRAVGRITASRVIGDRDGASVRVYALGDQIEAETLLP